MSHWSFTASDANPEEVLAASEAATDGLVQRSHLKEILQKILDALGGERFHVSASTHESSAPGVPAGLTIAVTKSVPPGHEPAVAEAQPAIEPSVTPEPVLSLAPAATSQPVPQPVPTSPEGEGTQPKEVVS
jgi:hypothetical protein